MGGLDREVHEKFDGWLQGIIHCEDLIITFKLFYFVEDTAGKPCE